MPRLWDSHHEACQEEASRYYCDISCKLVMFSLSQAVPVLKIKNEGGTWKTEDDHGDTSEKRTKGKAAQDDPKEEGGKSTNGKFPKAVKHAPKSTKAKAAKPAPTEESDLNNNHSIPAGVVVVGNQKKQYKRKSFAGKPAPKEEAQSSTKGNVVKAVKHAPKEESERTTKGKVAKAAKPSQKVQAEKSTNGKVAKPAPKNEDYDLNSDHSIPEGDVVVGELKNKAAALKKKKKSFAAKTSVPQHLPEHSYAKHPAKQKGPAGIGSVDISYKLVMVPLSGVVMVREAQEHAQLSSEESTRSQKTTPPIKRALRNRKKRKVATDTETEATKDDCKKKEPTKTPVNGKTAKTEKVVDESGGESGLTKELFNTLLIEEERLSMSHSEDNLSHEDNLEDMVESDSNSDENNGDGVGADDSGRDDESGDSDDGDDIGDGEDNDDEHVTEIVTTTKNGAEEKNGGCCKKKVRVMLLRLKLPGKLSNEPEDVRDVEAAPGGAAAPVDVATQKTAVKGKAEKNNGKKSKVTAETETPKDASRKKEVKKRGVKGKTAKTEKVVDNLSPEDNLEDIVESDGTSDEKNNVGDEAPEKTAAKGKAEKRNGKKNKVAAVTEKKTAVFLGLRKTAKTDPEKVVDNLSPEDNVEAMVESEDNVEDMVESEENVEDVAEGEDNVEDMVESKDNVDDMVESDGNSQEKNGGGEGDGSGSDEENGDSDDSGDGENNEEEAADDVDVSSAPGGASAAAPVDECIVCYDPLVSPVMLRGCAHVFCRRCLERIMMDSFGPGGKASRCPQCRKVFTNKDLLADYDDDGEQPSSPTSREHDAEQLGEAPTSPLSRERSAPSREHDAEQLGEAPTSPLSREPMTTDADEPAPLTEDDEETLTTTTSAPIPDDPSGSGTGSRRTTRGRGPVASQMVFSSYFAVNNPAVNARIQEATELLNIAEYRKVKTIRQACARVLRERTDHIMDGESGPEGSFIVDVPGDGNCLFHSLCCLLLGRVPPLEAVQAARNAMVDAILRAPKTLGRVLSFRGDGELLRVKGLERRFKDLQSWAKAMRKMGTWGDSSFIQMFSDYTGIIVHTYSNEFPNVQGTTNFVPHSPERRMYECQIVVAYDRYHYQVIVPALNQLPSTVQWHLNEDLPAIDTWGGNLTSDSDDADYVFPSSEPSSEEDESPEAVHNWAEHLATGAYVKRDRRNGRTKKWKNKESTQSGKDGVVKKVEEPSDYNKRFNAARGGKKLKQHKLDFPSTEKKKKTSEDCELDNRHSIPAGAVVVGKHKKKAEPLKNKKKYSADDDEVVHTYTYTYRCPFADCVFSTDFDGLPAAAHGKAAHHMKVGSVQEWKSLGLKWKKSKERAGIIIEYEHLLKF